MTKGTQISTLRLLSNENLIIAVGDEYLTQDGRIIKKVNNKFQVEGKEVIYNSLFGAYYDSKF